jgi:hypothetical protein
MVIETVDRRKFLVNGCESQKSCFHLKEKSWKRLTRKKELQELKLVSGSPWLAMDEIYTKCEQTIEQRGSHGRPEAI